MLEKKLKAILQEDSSNKRNLNSQTGLIQLFHVQQKESSLLQQKITSLLEESQKLKELSFSQQNIISSLEKENQKHQRRAEQYVEILLLRDQEKKFLLQKLQRLEETKEMGEPKAVGRKKMSLTLPSFQQMKKTVQKPFSKRKKKVRCKSLQTSLGSIHYRILPY